MPTSRQSAKSSTQLVLGRFDVAVGSEAVVDGDGGAVGHDVARYPPSTPTA